jgi:hypothetical protein
LLFRCAHIQENNPSPYARKRQRCSGKQRSFMRIKSVGKV